jgi:diguanylate cyclase (GGDEF)-like protein
MTTIHDAKQTAIADDPMLTGGLMRGGLMIDALGLDPAADAKAASSMAEASMRSQDHIVHQRGTGDTVARVPRCEQDPLTGLANRLWFQRHLEDAFLAHDASRGLCLLLLDLDDFREVNDSRGHSVGDRLLAEAGRRVSRTVPPGTAAARLGGDEFAVLLTGIHDLDEATALAEGLVQTLGAPLELDGVRLPLGVSVGVASAVTSSNAEELLRNADLALYAAKECGKGQWQVYEGSLHDASVERAAVRTDLDQAIADGALMIEYQPVVELQDGRIAGFEALVRWPHPTMGLLGPDRFIPLAESSGQIMALGRWVVREAVSQAATWGADVWVGINVSGRQFEDPGLVEAVRMALAESRLDPRRLVLEVTESWILEHGNQQVQEVLIRLKALGVRIALDDFGTGYSSLSYLREIPADILKIDKSFVSGIARSMHAAKLLNGIVQIAHALAIEVIAEGIETPQQRDLLAETSCRYGQGFLFGRPNQAARVQELLRSPAHSTSPRNRDEAE